MTQRRISIDVLVIRRVHALFPARVVRREHHISRSLARVGNCFQVLQKRRFIETTPLQTSLQRAQACERGGNDCVRAQCWRALAIATTRLLKSFTEPFRTGVAIPMRGT